MLQKYARAATILSTLGLFQACASTTLEEELSQPLEGEGETDAVATSTSSPDAASFSGFDEVTSNVELGDCTDPCGCSAGLAPQGAQATPSDILMVVDRSGSMESGFTGGGLQSRWDALRGALRDTLPGLSNKGFGFGALVYPHRVTNGVLGIGARRCRVPDSPQVAIQSETQSTLDLFDDIRPDGDTPTADALKNARSYLSAQASTERERVVLLVTDGVPNCGRGEDEVVKEINALKELGVRTAVLGVDAEGNQQLASFARAGDLARPGTRPYYNASTAAELKSSLELISRSAASCTYAIRNEAPEDWRLTEVRNAGVPLNPESFTVEGSTGRDLKVTLGDELCAQMRAGTLKVALSGRFSHPSCNASEALY